MLKKIQPIKSRQGTNRASKGRVERRRAGHIRARGGVVETLIAHPVTTVAPRRGPEARGSARGTGASHGDAPRRRGGKDSPRGSFFSLGRDGNARGADLTERGGRGLRCLPRSARASSIPPADWAEPRAAAPAAQPATGAVLPVPVALEKSRLKRRRIPITVTREMFECKFPRHATNSELQFARRMMGWQ